MFKHRSVGFSRHVCCTSVDTSRDTHASKIRLASLSHSSVEQTAWTLHRYLATTRNNCQCTIPCACFFDVASSEPCCPIGSIAARKVDSGGRCLKLRIASAFHALTPRASIRSDRQRRWRSAFVVRVIDVSFRPNRQNQVNHSWLRRDVCGVRERPSAESPSPTF